MVTRYRKALYCPRLPENDKTHPSYGEKVGREYRKTFFSLADLTSANLRRWWKKGKAPRGLKIDLYRTVPLELPSDEETLYEEEASHASRWIVRVSSRLGDECYTRVHRWGIKLPRYGQKEMRVWVPLNGFHIAGIQVYPWRLGCEKLLKLTEEDGRKLGAGFVYEIKYGKRRNGIAYNSIRFFCEQKNGRWYHQIQTFTLSEVTLAWIRHRRLVCWPIDSPALGHALLGALLETQIRRHSEMLPAPGVEVIDISTDD